MPLRWTREENPYRLNYFRVLQLGAQASQRRITDRRKQLAKKVAAGGEHQVEGRAMAEADLTEAESRLLDPASWAAEVLLVHPRPETEERNLAGLVEAVNAATEPEVSVRPLPLTDITALAPLVPRLDWTDLPRPAWDELSIPGPDNPHDLSADIQFDL